MKITIESCSDLYFPNSNFIDADNDNDENENENENENEESFRGESQYPSGSNNFRNNENRKNSNGTKFTHGDGTVKSADWTRNGETEINGKSSQYGDKSRISDNDTHRNNGIFFNFVLSGRKSGDFWQAVSTPVRYHFR